MKDMTTAEFAKANLAALQEPVKIRRYTKAVGTYYPEGYIAALPSATIRGTIDESHMEGDIRVIDQMTVESVGISSVPTTTGFAPIIPAPDQTSSLSAAREKIEDLEAEVKRLKKELAARPPVGSEFMGQERRTVPTHPMKDVFSDLAKQDREFFERKLGTKKK